MRSALKDRKAPWDRVACKASKVRWDQWEHWDLVARGGPKAKRVPKESAVRLALRGPPEKGAYKVHEESKAKWVLWVPKDRKAPQDLSVPQVPWDRKGPAGAKGRPASADRWVWRGRGGPSVRQARWDLWGPVASRGPKETRAISV